MGKSLILSVKTKRMMPVHDDITGAFTYAEQLCGLEHLRVFRDYEAGGVFALIHYSPQFREGSMTSYLNSARDPIRVRDDDERSVRIKGLVIALENKKSLQRQVSAEHGTPPQSSTSPKARREKKITGAKIEFYTQSDKQIFKETLREIQGTFFCRVRVTQSCAGISRHVPYFLVG